MTARHCKTAATGDGFEPMPARSPVLDLVGPLWGERRGPRRPLYGLLVESRHSKSRGTVHGGVLSTAVNLVLGYGTQAAEPDAGGLTGPRRCPPLPRT